MNLTIWHNPRCSKSRQALSLLEDQGVAPNVRLYLTDTPDEEELRMVLTALGIPAADLLRTGEPVYKEIGLTKDSSEDKIIAAMAKYPKLIERPVVLKDGKAALGRPPENVLDLI